MATVQITLPDQLAQQAEQAGLLQPDAIEGWLRERLRTQNVDRLFSAMDRMAAADMPNPLSSEEVAAEIAAVRAERRRRA
jgi:hypothetical protein